MLGAQVLPVVKRRKGRFLCLFLNWHTYFLFLDFRSKFETSGEASHQSHPMPMFSSFWPQPQSLTIGFLVIRAAGMG